FDGTAPEILRALGDRITHFVAGVGTSGTMMGAGRRFRAHDRPVRNVAVEPDEPLHGLEGLKHMPSSLVPAIYDTSVPHETMRVGTEDGWDMADRLAREEGLHVGHSSGANVFAAVRVAEREHAAWVRAGASGPEPKTVAVAIVCDRGDRYFAPLAWDKRHVY
ncbi:MAG: pyridoxal-phosphate dependent enzyme, partial [Polyangiaceae bacterium]